MALPPVGPSPLADRIRAAGTSLIVARASFDSWWTYKSHDTRPLYLPGMQHYSEFFRYDEEAHFRTMVVGLYTLFDSRRDTANFSRMLADSRAGGHPLPATEARLDGTGVVVAKVASLRHNLFAHRNHGLTYEDVYAAANITPNELRGLLDESRCMRNELGAAHGVAEMDFNPFVTGHLVELLKLIQPVEDDE